MTRFDQFFSVAEKGSSEQIFAQLDRLVQSEIGATIFSCSTFDPATRRARRVYTNQPAAYPLSGLKDIVPSRWTETVLDGGEIFVANTIEEIAQVFPDHELIADLGCASVVNVPIKLAGSILGTINLLDAAGHYNQARVGKITKLKPAATIAFAALNEKVCGR